jgi:hypothetical protein
MDERVNVIIGGIEPLGDRHGEIRRGHRNQSGWQFGKTNRFLDRLKKMKSWISRELDAPLYFVWSSCPGKNALGDRGKNNWLEES